MGEIKIQVTPSKPQSLQVGTRNVKNSVEVEQNPTHYYSTLAKQWAVKIDGMVQDEDYSAKYWATQSKNSAEIAEASIETNTNLTELLSQNYQTYLNDLTDEHTQALSDITTKKDESLNAIETTTTEKITELNNLSNTATEDITNAKKEAVEIIDNVKNVSIEEVEQEGTKQVDNIKQTGFYMKDGKLYYIDEDGKEVEFSGSDITTSITNCLLEVPQRINYTLENGTFTLKAGSVIIVPFSTEAPALAIGDFLEGASNNNNFKIVDIQYKNNQLFYWCEVQNDITQTDAATGSIIRFIAVTISGTNLEQWLTWNTYTSSAATLPSDTKSYMWYQPNNNKVVHTDNTTAHNVDRTLSLPIVKVQSDNGTVFNTVLEVFNGMGDIGGINWVDKGVKGLIPYYRNEDRTLKSISFAQTELTLSINRSSITSATQLPLLGNYQEDTGCIVPYQMLSNNYYYESDVQPNVTNQYAVWYDTYNNILKETSDTGQTWTEKISLKIGHGTIDDGVLNSSYNTPFQALDINGGTMTGVLNFDVPGEIHNIKIFSDAVDSYRGITIINNYADSSQGTVSVQENYMAISGQDKNHKETGQVLNKHMTNGTMRTCLRAFKQINGANKTGEISVNVDVNGNVYGLAPTWPTYTDSSTKIATTAFVQNALKVNSSMPSTKVTSLSFPASGGTSYTAPADGYFILRFYGSSSTNGNIYNSTTHLQAFSYSTTGSHFVALFLPVSKGDKISANYDNVNTSKSPEFKFIYANSYD